MKEYANKNLYLALTSPFIFYRHVNIIQDKVSKNGYKLTIVKATPLERKKPTVNEMGLL